MRYLREFNKFSLTDSIEKYFEEFDNESWMKITNSLIQDGMFAKKATFKFIDYNSIDKSVTKKNLEDYLMSGAKDGKWDEKSAKEYLMAVVGTAANEKRPLREKRNNTKSIFEEIRPLTYSGGNVTEMSIIGKVITKPIGPFESGEYDIVEIIETEKGPIYVANMWYKEYKRIPQLIHSELVEEFMPITKESFDMYRDKCDRCGGSTNGTTIMSVFNEDIICMSCKEEERKDPEYKAASKAESEAYKRGIRDFKGAIPDYKPLK